MVYTFDRANANAPTRHRTQYFELGGYRGIYHDGWYACTQVLLAPWQRQVGAKLPNPLEYPWELYDLTKDWTQFEDVAAKNPGKLKELQQVFMEEARKYEVFPLDNRRASSVAIPQTPASAPRGWPTITPIFSWGGAKKAKEDGIKALRESCVVIESGRRISMAEIASQLGPST